MDIFHQFGHDFARNQRHTSKSRVTGVRDEGEALLATDETTAAAAVAAAGTGQDEGKGEREETNGQA